MASVYLAPVVGDGLSIATAFSTGGFEGIPHATLMIDTVKKQAIVASSTDTVVASGVTRILTGPSWEELRANGKKNTPNPSQRTRLNAWLTNAGYQPTTAAQVTWEDCVLFAARQVNPDASLDIVYAARQN